MEALKAMKEGGYAGYIDFEYEGREYTPRQATIEGVRRMREMMASLDSSIS
jgi:hydroxypyruvate isomerase